MSDVELTKKLLDKFNHCPNCGSENLDAGDKDGAAVLSVAVECGACGAEWTEHYRFFSASDFKAG